MRHVTMQPPVQLVDLSSGKPLKELDPRNPRNQDGSANFRDRAPMTMTEWIIDGPMRDPKLGKDYKSLLAGSRIKLALDKANGVLALEESDWEMLRDAIEKPSGSYDPHLGIQCVQFMRAIVEATEA